MAIRLSRPKNGDHEDNSAFWLITYSDMVTLLLAFFLILYSFSVMSDDRRKELVDELRTVANNDTRVEAPRADLEGAAREIAAQFAKEDAFVENTEAEVTVGLSSEVTFASGAATLSPVGRASLEKAATILARLPNTIRVEGHTDGVPIRNERFSSNWDLSAARAQSVVRLLVEGGVDARRLQVVGYADVRPRAGNESAEGRAANRRIEIKILRKPTDG